METQSESNPAQTKAQQTVDSLRRIFAPLCERLKPEIEPAVTYALNTPEQGPHKSE